MAEHLLVADGLGKTYGDVVKTTALSDVTFSVERGEFASVIGQSGSGKSTLLNLIGLLDTPTTGQVLVDGRETAALGRRGRAVGRRGRAVGRAVAASGVVQSQLVVSLGCGRGCLAGPRAAGLGRRFLTGLLHAGRLQDGRHQVGLLGPDGRLQTQMGGNGVKLVTLLTFEDRPLKGLIAHACTSLLTFVCGGSPARRAHQRR